MHFIIIIIIIIIIDNTISVQLLLFQRLNRFMPNSKGSEMHQQMPEENKLLVSISCICAVALVILFFLVTYLVDKYQRYVDPNYKYHVY